MYGGRKGSMVSFSFRLLLAKLPSYLGLLKSSLDRLTEMSITCYEIREHFSQQQNEAATEFWLRREQVVLCSLINCALSVMKSPLGRRKETHESLPADERLQFG